MSLKGLIRDASALLVVLVAQAAHANLITVTSTNDPGAGSLRDAIAQAGNGDTIVFDAALSGKTITLSSGEILIACNIEIEGPGPAQLAVTGITTTFENVE